MVGAGASFSPQLREVSHDNARFEASALRLGGFVAFDVPLLPLN